MDMKLILTAAKAVRKSYTNPINKIHSTEWNTSVIMYEGKPLQIISVPGTKGVVDWLWNIVLASRKGVKLAAYISANRIFKNFTRFGDMPLLIAGHSKAGPTALYLGQLLNADHVIGFCPAPGFRKRRQLKNSLVVIDPDDVVPKLGKINFKQPYCEQLILKNDHKGLYFSDHSMDHVIGELESRVLS